MTRISQRRSTLRRDAFDAHFSHQSLHSLAVDNESLVLQEVDHLPRTAGGMPEVFFIH